MADHEKGWRNAKHREQWRTTLARYASPAFGKLPVAAIDETLVLPCPEADLAHQAANLRHDCAAASKRSWIGPVCMDTVPERTRLAGRAICVLGAIPRQGSPGKAPCRATLCREGNLHGGVAPEARWRGQGAGIRDPDGSAKRRGAGGHLGRNRPCREGMDGGCGAHEGRATASRPDFGCRRSHPRVAACGSHQRPCVFRGQGGRPLSGMALPMLLRRKWRSPTPWGMPWKRGDLFDKRRKLMEAWAEFCAAASASNDVVPPEPCGAKTGAGAKCMLRPAEPRLTGR